MRRCSDHPSAGSQDTGQNGLKRCPAAGLGAGGRRISTPPTAPTFGSLILTHLAKKKLWARLPKTHPPPALPPTHTRLPVSTDNIWAAVTQPHVCRPAADRTAQQPRKEKHFYLIQKVEDKVKKKYPLKKLQKRKNFLWRLFCNFLPSRKLNLFLN